MKHQSVLSIAPLRISFLGGGSDIKSFYMNQKGAVISAAIDKYVYVHVKRHDSLFQEKYRISYSEIEHVQSREEIKNKIVRSCLEFLDIEEPLQISTSSDLPAFSGLGSSSSFAVALLLALHSLKGEEISRAQLAEEACAVEIDLLKSPIGKQDQYAAAFGGLNLFEFLPNNSVSIEPIILSQKKAEDFLSKSRLIWTEKMRDAGVVLHDQAGRVRKNEESIKGLVSLVYDFRSSLHSMNIDLEQLGKLILEGWGIKKTLSPMIVSSEIEALESLLHSKNCFGYKLLGAGAGGFIFALLRESHISADLTNYKMFEPRIDQLGARVLSIS